MNLSPLIPAKAGIQSQRKGGPEERGLLGKNWIPASAGMSGRGKSIRPELIPLQASRKIARSPSPDPEMLDALVLFAERHLCDKLADGCGVFEAVARASRRNDDVVAIANVIDEKASIGSTG